MDRPKSIATDAEHEAAARMSGDPRLREKLDRKRYGDGLDRLSLRYGMDDWAPLIAAVFAMGMYLVGELPFAWQAGTVVLPSLKTGEMHLGGAVLVFNSLLFLLSVFLYIADGRPFFAKRGQSGNRWTLMATGTAALALFAIYTAQTQAADEVRVIVEKRETLEKKATEIEVKITETKDTMPSRRAAELELERAQDEAVGSKLNTVTAGEAKIFCADVAEFEANMMCRQKILRASVDCTQDVSTSVRDGACDPIKAAQMRLARIDDMEKLQKERAAELARIEKQLGDLPEASNYFVRQIANLAKWSVPDAQSRIYIFIGLLCLLVPAAIFAIVFVRRQDPQPQPVP